MTRHHSLAIAAIAFVMPAGTTGATEIEVHATP